MQLKNKKTGGKAQKVSKERMYALGRLKSGSMNKTEAAYAKDLEARKLTGEILWYAFDKINLRIGEKCFYKVDFFVMLSSGELEAHEVKGFWTDDALVKIKVASESFPFRFISAKFTKGRWEFREF